MATTRSARIDAENGHRRVTRSRLRIIVKETRGYRTGYLRTPSDMIKYDHGSREVGYDKEIILSGCWIITRTTRITRIIRINESPESARQITRIKGAAVVIR